jgi:LmbE family N-acetylglucosaminyl deacetylase
MKKTLILEPGHMHVLCIGAHPDDCEFRCGGTAALWRRQGNQVTMLSVTNGQSGHHELSPEQVSIRRKKEAKAASKIIGAESIVLPLPDGTLEPSVENRLMLMRHIRKIAPDIIISNRPNDYHPDHRYTSQLVQDCAYMLMVPNVASDVPALRYNPVVLYWADHFKEPVSFQPDIVLNIDPVFEQKLLMLNAHQSQVYEWLPWVGGISLDTIPRDAQERMSWLKKYVKTRRKNSEIAEIYRDALIERYGRETGSKVEQAEAFQLCEYGTQPDAASLARIFDGM